MIFHDALSGSTLKSEFSVCMNGSQSSFQYGWISLTQQTGRQAGGQTGGPEATLAQDPASQPKPRSVYTVTVSASHNLHPNLSGGLLRCATADALGAIAQLG